MPSRPSRIWRTRRLTTSISIIVVAPRLLISSATSSPRREWQVAEDLLHASGPRRHRPASSSGAKRRPRRGRPCRLRSRRRPVRMSACPFPESSLQTTATPIERTFASALRATRSTSSMSVSSAAAPPAILIIRMSPAMPRRSCMRSGRCSGNIVAHAHGADVDAVIGQHLRCNVEVHVVAGIVAIEEDDPLAAMHRLCGLIDDVGRRRGEDLAAGRAVAPCSLPMKPWNTGSWPLPPPISSATLPSGISLRTSGIHIRVLEDPAVIGQFQPFDHFGDGLPRIVQDFLGFASLVRCPRCCRPHRLRRGITHVSSIV